MSAYEQFLTDPAFAALFTAAYQGRHEPGDALWWLEHPSSAGPSGAHSPVAELASVRNNAYARGADAAAHDALARLEAETSVDRGATLEALAVARRPPEPASAREVEDVASAAPPRRWQLIAAVAVVALLVGGFAGRQLAQATTDPEVILVGTPEPSAPRSTTVPDLVPGMTEALERLPTKDDTPAVQAAMIAPGTERRLTFDDGPDDGRAVEVYGARHAGGSLICLILELDDEAVQAITCEDPAVIGPTGISVYAISGDTYTSARWLPSGSLETGQGPN